QHTATHTTAFDLSLLAPLHIIPNYTQSHHPAIHLSSSFFFNDPPTTEIYTLSLHDALPIFQAAQPVNSGRDLRRQPLTCRRNARSEEHTSELQSLTNLVCRLLLEKKKRTRRQLMGDDMTAHDVYDKYS